MSYMGDMNQLGGLKKLAKKATKAAKKVAKSAVSVAKVVVPAATGITLAKKVADVQKAVITGSSGGAAEIAAAANQIAKPAVERESLADASRQVTRVKPHISRRNAPRIQHALRTGTSGGAAEVAVGSNQSGADPVPLVKAAMETYTPPSAFSSTSSMNTGVVPPDMATETAGETPGAAADAPQSKMPLILLALGVGGFFLMRKRA